MGAETGQPCAQNDWRYDEVVTARQRSCGKVMFSEVFVCPHGCIFLWSHVLSRGWVSLVPGPLGWEVCPGCGNVWGVGMSRGGYSPYTRQGILWDMVSKRVVHILLACSLVFEVCLLLTYSFPTVKAWLHTAPCTALLFAISEVQNFLSVWNFRQNYTIW